jgi:hypothetical protein
MLSFQILFPTAPPPDANRLAALLRDWHPEFAAARVAWSPAPAADWLAPEGPPADSGGEVAWDAHRVRFAVFGHAMPYGPVRACVDPAMLPDEIKADAAAHAAHTLLYYAGNHPDPLEQFVALGAVAGAVGRAGGIAILNEDARAAVPAFDLIPEAGEDLLATLRGLPIPYLYGGFQKLDLGDPDRPWARTWACHRLGLPDLGMRLSGHHETSDAFRLFAGVLGYLRESGERFAPGDGLDLGDRKLTLRAPAEAEWYLESEGEMLVIETTELHR